MSQTDSISAGPAPGRSATAADPLSYALGARDSDVMSMVRDALDAGRAQLAFQPVVTAGDTGQIAFHEGLIRLMDQTGRVIPARQFMGAVEETPLGREIDCAALSLALEALKADPVRRISINASARSLADMAWRRALETGLSRDPTLGERLILEINENSAMLLPDVITRFMEDMQPQGLSFALDDFGGGMTAFRHLKEFLFDLVKIAPCFVRGIDTDPDNRVLTEALITVAQQFEMFVVAPGIESAGEAAVVAELGADCLQGYHLGVPKMSI